MITIQFASQLKLTRSMREELAASPSTSDPLRIGGKRRRRAMTLVDLFEHADITPVIFSHLDLASIVRLTGLDRAIRALRLTNAIQEVSNEELGCHRLPFLRLVGSRSGSYGGLRRLLLNKGMEEDSHVALCAALRSAACPCLEVLDLSESCVTDSRLLRLLQSLEQGRNVGVGQGEGAERSKRGKPVPLRELRLNNNPLGNAGAATLGRLVRAHTGLQRLHATRLRLTGSGVRQFFQTIAPVQTPAASGSANSRSANGDGCSLRLESLSFSTVLVGYAELSPLFDSLRGGGLRHLRHLDLSFLPLRDDGTKMLCRCLQEGGCPQLASLVLARTQMGRGALEALGQSLVTPAVVGSGGGSSGGSGWGRRLTRLDLAGNLFDHELGLTALCVAVRRGGLPRLQHLSLSECGMGAASFHVLAAALQDPACGLAMGLRHLDLSQNLAGDGAALSLFSGFLRPPILLPCPSTPLASTSGCQLEELRLSNCGLQASAVVALASGLSCRALPRLRVLHVGDEGSFSHGLATLAEALREGSCPVLGELRLCGLREVEAEQCMAAAVALADAVGGPLAKTLRSLQLYRLFVGPCHVALSLAQALTQTKGLEVLHLEGNELGALGAEALAQALGSGALTQLSTLCLSGNDVGDDGLVALSAALYRHDARCRRPLSGLRTLKLARNGIGARGMRCLGAALRKGACQRLVTLDLDDNPLGDRGVSLLMTSLLPAPVASPFFAPLRPFSKRSKLGADVGQPGRGPSGAGDIAGKQEGAGEGGGLSGWLQSAGHGLVSMLRWGAIHQDPNDPHGL